ncbi:MAG TPA: GIY-YIG nuclease family protein [Polyangia bacterium]
MRQPSWSVYLLRCADDTLYCGCTNDVARRLAAHARGRVKYTRGRLPVELAHVEAVADKSAALRREHEWKRLPRAEKLRRMSRVETPPAESATCTGRANSLSQADVENCRTPLPGTNRRRRRVR